MNQDLFVTMALQAWNTQITRVDDILNTLSEQQLMAEIAPGRNRGIYLIGHLLVIHDTLNHVIGLGSRAHAELDEAFVKNPDKSGFDMPSINDLKHFWKELHQQLNVAFQQMQPEDWFKKHNNMTDGDFEKEPARNKLSVLINRTNHAAFHNGQLRLLK